jgi:adenylate cyclase
LQIKASGAYKIWIPNIFDFKNLVAQNDWQIMAADITPRSEDIRLQLERILASEAFRGSDKQRKFLSFVVDETLESRGTKIKGYTIAVTVYGRKSNFDPQVDPIVRVEAGRLRRALEHYYLTSGRNDPVRIEIPKGGYKPNFYMTQIAPSEAKTPTPDNKDGVRSEGPSIAVLPLVSFTEDNDQEYLTEGLTEELTIELARYQDFRVIASQSTMRFKDQTVDIRQVGRDLDVQFLLAGSVRRDSKTVKVTIRLLDTSTGVQIWGESYKRDQTAADLIAVQEEIAGRVVGVIADQYGIINRGLSKESHKKAPADLRAYDAVLRFYHYETELTPQAFAEALAALEQAVKIDPEYGLAWSMLGHLHADNYALGFCEIEEPLDKALTYAKKGVALAPQNQLARDALTLVYFHRGDKELFLQHAEQAIALNPNSPYIVGVAGWHMILFGEWDRGLKLLKKGMKLNPYHPSWFHLAPFMDYYRRSEYEDAYSEALKFNFPSLYLDPMMRAAALGQLGKHNQAKTALNQLLGLEPDFTKRGRLLVSRYVKVEDLVDAIFEGLHKAGLVGLE